MSIVTITILLFVALLVALASGLPIAFCLGGIAIGFTYFLWGPKSLRMVYTTTMGQMATIIMLAIPLFIFMGNMLERSGIAERLYDMIYRWVGSIRGGLASGTVFICAIFAAMAGISGAATVTMGLIALPSMLKRGYDKRLVTGCIQAGGALGILIPPSVIMIVYAFMAGQSVGRLFAGGIIPGLLLAALFILYITIRCSLQPNVGPATPIEERSTWKEKFTSLRAVILPILLIILVLGSIFAGIATPTEAAAIGAGGAVLCSALYRRLTWKNFKEATYRSLELTCMIMWIVIGAACFTAVYHAIGAPQLMSEVLASLGVNKWIVLAGIQFSFFLLGCLLDPVGILMITTPVFIPVITSLGFDPVWFGVLFVVNMEMAFLTPPFGVNLFYMKGIVPKEISMVDIYISIIPFVIIQAIGLVIVILFPQLILWLPNLIFGMPM